MLGFAEVGMGQTKGAGGKGPWGHPPNVPWETTSTQDPRLPAASESICQTPSHRGLSPTCPLLAPPQLSADNQIALGAHAGADLRWRHLLHRAVASATAMHSPPEGPAQ